MIINIRSICFAFLCLFLWHWCGLPSQAADDHNVLKVGFVCVGPVSDHGWNYAHNQGRLYLENSMDKKVETSIAERIPESAEVERVLERLIAQGDKLIFTTSYGYLEPALRVSLQTSRCGLHAGQPIRVS